jgi:hypothetical protein
LTWCRQRVGPIPLLFAQTVALLGGWLIGLWGQTAAGEKQRD